MQSVLLMNIQTPSPQITIALFISPVYCANVQLLKELHIACTCHELINFFKYSQIPQGITSDFSMNVRLCSQQSRHISSGARDSGATSLPSQRLPPRPTPQRLRRQELPEACPTFGQTSSIFRPRDRREESVAVCDETKSSSFGRF